MHVVGEHEERKRSGSEADEKVLRGRMIEQMDVARKESNQCCHQAVSEFG